MNDDSLRASRLAYEDQEDRGLEFHTGDAEDHPSRVLTDSPRCTQCEHIYDARLATCPVCEVARLNGELTRLQRESQRVQHKLDTVHINLRKAVNWLQGQD